MSATILKSPDIPLSEGNILILTPDLLSLDESILFYHIIDDDITNYVVYQYNTGESTKVYFDNNIGSIYNVFAKYN